jgi:hypothetical protein
VGGAGRVVPRRGIRKAISGATCYAFGVQITSRRERAR